MKYKRRMLRIEELNHKINYYDERFRKLFLSRRKATEELERLRSIKRGRRRKKKYG